MTKRAIVGLIVALICLVRAPFLCGQTTTTLYGTVTDKSGAVVPGADVTGTNVDTNFTRSAKTNAEGQYRLEFMPIGKYTVEASATGFKSILT